MYWIDNRYYTLNANYERRLKGLKLYKKPRFYLIDDFNGRVIHWALSRKELITFYKINKGHLQWLQPRF